MEKSKITILATGGTIAGRGDSAEATTGYRAGAFSADDLVKAVPGLVKHADIMVETISTIDSKDMTDAIWFALSRRVNELQRDPGVNGIVVTHGTDTMEETAFFLALTVQGEKPVVLTGAMRPATAISADGPMNLLNAVKLAASPVARGRGVLVTMDDTIFSALDVRKTDTLSLHTFQGDLGPLGRLEGGQVHFFRQEVGALPSFDIAGLTKLPRVYILYGHAGADGFLIRAAAGNAEGLVYAGPGNGSIHKEDEIALAEAVARGIPVVRASRASGPVIAAEKSYEEHGFISAGLLSPQKARILLQLAVAFHMNIKECFRQFCQ